MANVQKYTRVSIGHLFAHYERLKDQFGCYVKFGNLSIDPSKTHLNYNLATEQTKPQLEFLHDRLSEVKVLHRDNVNVMCSWVITMPQTLPEDKRTQFFDECYNFLCNRYGKENCISAYVHLDETTPHMHHTFVPITADGRCSAKEVICRKDLLTFHKDLQEYLEDKLQCKVDILNDATKDGNKTINELKRESKIIVDRLDKICKTIDETSYGFFHKKIIDKHDLQKMDALVEDYKKTVQDLTSIIYDKDRILDDSLKEIRDERVRVREEQIALECQNQNLIAQVKNLNKRINDLQNTINDLRDENASLSKYANKQADTVKSLTNKNNALKRKIQNLEGISKPNEQEKD